MFFILTSDTDKKFSINKHPNFGIEKFLGVVKYFSTLSL